MRQIGDGLHSRVVRAINVEWFVAALRRRFGVRRGAPLLTALVGFQHVSLVRIQLIFPALVIQLAELPTEASISCSPIPNAKPFA